MKTMLEYAILGYLFRGYHWELHVRLGGEAGTIIEHAASIAFKRLGSPAGESGHLPEPYRALVLDAMDAFREQAKAFFILSRAVGEEA